MSFASRWSDVYLATGARAISSAGDYLAATALAITLQARGSGGLAVAAVTIAAAMPPVVLSRWTGRLADRVDSRLLLVTAGLVQAAVCVALASVTGTAAIVGLVAVLGCGLAVTQPVLAALLPAMVRQEDLPRASALGQAATSIGVLIGPAVSGILMGTFGLRVPLLIDAASYLALTLAGLLIRTRRGRVRRERSAASSAPLSLRADTLLWTMFVLVGAVVAGVCAVNVGEVFLVRGALHASTTVFGVLSGSWSLGMMVGSWLIGRRRLDDGGLAVTLLVNMLITCVLVALCGVPSSVGWLFPLFLLGGATNGAENVAASLLIARRVPAAAHGRAYARYTAVSNGACVVGFVLGGVLVGLMPVRIMVVGAGVAGVLISVVMAFPMLRAVAAERAAKPKPLVSVVS